MKLADLTRFLDEALRIREIPDYSGAMNGLQLENGGEVTRIVAAVDASLPVIEKAAAGGPGLLLVHHGMFWQGAQPLRGAMFRKIKTAMDAGLAIYSAHLPLDVHPEWGNNMGLARALGVEVDGSFLEWKGMPLGVQGEWSGSREALVAALEVVVDGPVHLCPGGRDRIKRVGIVTGGAGSEVAAAAAAGVDVFITGEGPHWSYPLAEEAGLNVCYAGHYATETFGVKALAAELARRFALEWSFVDHPTGL